MKIHPRTVLIHIVAWAIALAWAIPFVGVAMTSIRPTREIRNGWWILTEFNPSVNNFVEVMTNPIFPLWRGLLNSLVVAIPATIIPMTVAVLAGYGFARFSFPIRDYLFLTIVLLMAVPQMMVAIPIFRLLAGANLVDNHLGLILIHAAWGLPWIILFMRNFMGSLPIEVEEAARVDGASDFKVFYKIVLPMALPALASVLVLQFMWVWNDFFFAQVLLGSSEKYLATQLIPRLALGQYHADWGLLTASSLIVMLVPVLIFAFLQKYYIRGMIGWTVKG